MNLSHASLAAVFTMGCSLAQAPPLVPPQAFNVPEGLEVTVWATSPMLHNPTNMDIDHHGRVWVTEGVNYRGKAKRRSNRHIRGKPSGRGNRSRKS